MLRNNEILAIMIQEQQSDEIVKKVVEKLDIHLVSPEVELVKQGSNSEDSTKTNNMYFIQKGKCQVRVTTPEFPQGKNV